jgi:hypothetical protein
MIERPVICSGSNIQPILKGAKTQTRLVMKPQPKPGHSILRDNNGFSIWNGIGNQSQWHRSERIECPYGVVGDTLWVRETWCENDWRPGTTGLEPDRDCIIAAYRADHANGKAYPAPWASRITLEITGVRVERLKDISDSDAIREGIDAGALVRNENHPFPDYVKAFRELWESINGPGAWDTNPLVWCIEFKMVTPS